MNFLDPTVIFPTGTTTRVLLQDIVARFLALEAKVAAFPPAPTLMSFANGVLTVTWGNGTVQTLNVGSSSIPATTGGGPTAADTNTYPLQQPAGSGAAGAPVALGTGPDQIEIIISNNPGDPTPPNVFAVLGVWGTNIVALTGALTVTSQVGYPGGQRFTINGTYSAIPTEIQIVGAGTGLTDPFVNALSYNNIPYEADADLVNSRATGTPSWGVGVYDSARAQVITWIPESAVPVSAPAAPPPALSTIFFATINGVVAPAGTLAALVSATPSGGTLVLPAGTIVGTTTVPTPMTITGAGMGKTIIDCAGLEPTYQKGIFVPLVPGVVIESMSLTGATLSSPGGGSTSGNYAAGVRDNGAGIGCIMSNVEIYACDMGIESIGGSWTCTSCDFHDNGMGDGYSHDVYFAGDAAPNVVTLDGCTSTCGPLTTHALKSRALTTIVNGGTFTGSGDPGNIGGSVVDVPDGGVVDITGSTLVTAAGAGNHGILTYAVESSKNSAAGSTVTLTNVVIEDNTGTGGIVRSGLASATLVLVNCTYKGTIPPTISGWGTVTGAFVVA